MQRAHHDHRHHAAAPSVRVEGRVRESRGGEGQQRGPGEQVVEAGSCVCPMPQAAHPPQASPLPSPPFSREGPPRQPTAARPPRRPNPPEKEHNHQRVDDGEPVHLVIGGQQVGVPARGPADLARLVDDVVGEDDLAPLGHLQVRPLVAHVLLLLGVAGGQRGRVAAALAPLAVILVGDGVGLDLKAHDAGQVRLGVLVVQDSEVQVVVEIRMALVLRAAAAGHAAWAWQAGRHGRCGLSHVLPAPWRAGSTSNRSRAASSSRGAAPFHRPAPALHSRCVRILLTSMKPTGEPRSYVLTCSPSSSRMCTMPMGRLSRILRGAGNGGQGRGRSTDGRRCRGVSSERGEGRERWPTLHSASASTHCLDSRRRHSRCCLPLSIHPTFARGSLTC